MSLDSLSPAQQRIRSGWILSPLGDLAIFTGPILMALCLIGWAASNGTLDRDVPPWMFALLVIACDVAHVYATAFRVYLDPGRFRERPGLYVGIPIACFVAGVLAYGFSAAFFWRVLAYLAVWHFVRQQWGWVAYTRAKGGEGLAGRRLDQLTIYAVTGYPLVYWHTHLPRDFAWFIEGDFASLPGWIHLVAATLHWGILAAFAATQTRSGLQGSGVNWAKIQVVVTTWIAWYGGIVYLNSDVAFTALNVLSHGVPYLAVVWSVERAQVGERRPPLSRFFEPRLAWLLLSLLILVGYLEEWMWDALVWQEHATLFLSVTNDALPTVLLGFVVPLLATPQATHYVLDGWLWKRRAHRDLMGWMET
ncbi:MAG: hypothetical protein AAGG01_07660 [Planctomycetota bacterium]